jgi:hypothetical protein
VEQLLLELLHRKTDAAPVFEPWTEKNHMF